MTKLYFNVLAALFCGLSFLSCNQSGVNNTEEVESEITTSDTTLATEDVDTDNLLALTAAENYKNDPRTKAYVDDLKETWKDTPKALTATFVRVEFGDYFHLVFEDSKNNGLDFGNANNTLDPYNLILESNEANSKFINKKFKLTWDWLPSSFNCCEGNMDEMIANIPTITSLQLVE